MKTCISHYDSGAYTPMQFLDAMSRHHMGAHTAALNDHLPWDSDDDRMTTAQTRMWHKRPIRHRHSMLQ